MAAAFVAANLWTLSAAAQGSCRLALQLALDISGSVDGREYRLQMDGIAWALEQPDVLAALIAMPSAPVVLSIFEWSGRDHQRVILDWWPMLSEADVAAVAGQLRSTTRRDAPVSTAVGAALAFGKARFATPPACARQVIDISGDGRNNDGHRPQDVRQELGNVQVNALVIGPPRGNAIGAMGREHENLLRYFRQEVISGPGAFVEPAEGYEDYARAMRRKLLRELDVVVLGHAVRP
ncbi:DUF1194 domain-containing protein [Tropicimonas aquimaris]|uniref:DUF1194 domain-containing protein n=1 Tax=Tropicimonas aquimaris TaxID=914152 RepID=A0ABW3ITH4_9RHOB